MERKVYLFKSDNEEYHLFHRPLNIVDFNRLRIAAKNQGIVLTHVANESDADIMLVLDANYQDDEFNEYGTEHEMLIVSLTNINKLWDDDEGTDLPLADPALPWLVHCPLKVTLNRQKIVTDYYGIDVLWDKLKNLKPSRESKDQEADMLETALKSILGDKKECLFRGFRITRV